MGLNDDMHSKLAASYGAGNLNDLVKQHESAQGLKPGTLFTQAYYLTALPAAGLTPVSTDYNDMAAQYWANVNLEPVLISDQILASTSADIQFLAIPATFRHLELFIGARGDTAAVTTTIKIEFNADTTATNYNTEILQGRTGAVAAALINNAAILTIPAATTTANHSGTHRVAVPDYASATFFKRAVCQSSYYNSTDYFSEVNTLAWLNTAAITRIDLKPSAGNFIIGSRFSLYGIN